MFFGYPSYIGKRVLYSQFFKHRLMGAARGLNCAMAFKTLTSHHRCPLSIYDSVTPIFIHLIFFKLYIYIGSLCIDFSVLQCSIRRSRSRARYML